MQGSLAAPLPTLSSLRSQVETVAAARLRSSTFARLAASAQRAYRAGLDTVAQKVAVDLADRVAAGATVQSAWPPAVSYAWEAARGAARSYAQDAGWYRAGVDDAAQGLEHRVPIAEHVPSAAERTQRVAKIRDASARRAARAREFGARTSANTELAAWKGYVLETSAIRPVQTAKLGAELYKRYVAGETVAAAAAWIEREHQRRRARRRR